jgi:hypothetical protein
MVIDAKLCVYNHEIGDYLAEAVENFVNGIDTKVKNIDICYLVLDEILQKARQAIEDNTKQNFDIQNDADFYAHANYMCSSFDYSEEDKEKLIKVLKKNKIKIENLESATQYFLSEIGIEQEDIQK